MGGATAQRTWREQEYEAGGARLVWHELGDGPPVVFLHGGPGHDHRLIRSLAEPLADRFRCVLPDQRGTGGSRSAGDDADTLHIDRLIEDIEALRAHLGEERLRLAGWSWGATLALLYSAVYPERLDRLALIAPGPLTFEMVEVYNANQLRPLTAAERATRARLVAELDAADQAGDREGYNLLHRRFTELTFRVSFFAPERAQAYLSTYVELLGDPYRMAKVNERILGSLAQFAHWERIGATEAPALLIYGYQDFEPVTQAYILKEWLPQLDLAFLNECGHWPWLEQPEPFFARLGAFLG